MIQDKKTMESSSSSEEETESEEESSEESEDEKNSDKNPAPSKRATEVNRRLGPPTITPQPTQPAKREVSLNANTYPTRKGI